MTKEQEKAKENVKIFIKSIRSDLVEKSKDNQELANDFETVLSILQEQQEENKKKDKIIEEMARFMTNKNIDEDICKYQVVEHCKDEEYGVTTNVCINCIKQYFERKAE